MRGSQLIVLITFVWASTAWAAMQLELTGNRPAINAYGIASISDEGLVFKTKPGQAGYKRYRWSEFSKKGLESLLVGMPAERAFIQKNPQARILYLSFIRAEILARTPKAAPPARPPIGQPVQAPIGQPVQAPIGFIKVKPKSRPALKLHSKSATSQVSEKDGAQEDAGGQDQAEFTLINGPPVPPPSDSKLNPTNWLTPGGLLFLLAISGLSAYSGYEIAGFRHRPVKMICTLSALLPIIVPLVVFLLPDPAEVHAQSVAEQNDRFLLQPSQSAMADPNETVVPGDETHIGKTTEEIYTPVTMECYHKDENHFSDRFFSNYFGRFYQASPPSGQSLVIQTSELFYPVHHISRLETETLSVVYAQKNEWLEESIEYTMIEEVRVETGISQ